MGRGNLHVLLCEEAPAGQDLMWVMVGGLREAIRKAPRLAGHRAPHADAFESVSKTLSLRQVLPLF